MPNPDPSDDPEGAAADALIAELEQLGVLPQPAPAPAPATVTLPAPPPGSRYTLIGPAMTQMLVDLCTLAHIPAHVARRRIKAALASDGTAPGKVAVLAQQLQRLPQVGWGSNKGQS
jgi:hypothetical protein